MGQHETGVTPLLMAGNMSYGEKASLPVGSVPISTTDTTFNNE